MSFELDSIAGAPQEIAAPMSSLEEAKLAVMADVTGVDKTTASGLRYSFLAYDDLVKALRSSMVKYGLSVFPCDVAVENRSSYTTSRGAEMMSTLATVTYRFTHTSGASQDVVVLTEAADSSDKSASKLMTQAMKYALRQFFLIETDEDDPDRSRPDPAEVREARLMSLLEKSGTPDEVRELARQSHDRSVTFTPNQRTRIAEAFNKRITELEASAPTREGTPGPEGSESEGDT